MSIYAEYAHGVVDKAEFDYLANIENRKERDYEDHKDDLPWGCTNDFDYEACEGCPDFENCRDEYEDYEDEREDITDDE